MIMEHQISNYQCPACTGPLQFSPDTGKVECEYCGSVYELAEIEAMYAQQEPADAQAEQWDTTGLSDDWGADAEGMKTYSCPSCTAELVCDAATAATSCPYCGSPTVVPGQFSGVLKPDYVIPFKMEKEDAVNALKKHYGKRFFLPRSFTAENHIQQVQGVYVPFWLFDGTAEGSAAFEATRSKSYTRGNYRIKETSHFTASRAGSVDFEKIPVDASTKMPDEHMDSLEPFNYDELKPFSTAYLPGFLADKYDVEMEDCQERVEERCKETLVNELEQTVEGYETVRKIGQNIRVKRGEVHYALLPVWLLNTKWQGQDFLFAMNGQTGKMVGDLPVDRKKYWTTFLALGAGLSVLFALLMLLTNANAEIGRPIAIGVVVSFLISLIVCAVLKSGMKNVAASREATAYMMGELNLKHKRDRFTHTTATRTEIQSDSASKAGSK